MFNKKNLLVIALLLVFVFSLAACSNQQEAAPETEQEQTPAEQSTAPDNPDVILATTTSTQDSGLLDVLIPIFEEETGYVIKTIAVGTGAALAMGEKGEADVLLVHAPDSEKKLIDSGVGINYQLVMHNDFVIIGPKDDPAQINGTKTAAEAFKKIADSGSLFVSRGDDSGTHKMELKLWEAAGITPDTGTASYQETGQGMGQTLNVAEQKSAYTLTDRATYLAQKDNLSLVIHVEGEKNLLNIYHVMQVNPEKFPKVNADGAKAFVEFLVAPDTQKIISEFGMDKYGQPLFFADAGKDEAELGQ
ncbi:MAG: substrate-binding domain-containing protein [Bacillota bacterium]|jgi:tungstate transport system substrate-binding protein|nr:solute-binding protein [Clostridia bacterium]